MAKTARKTSSFRVVPKRASKNALAVKGYADGGSVDTEDSTTVDPLDVTASRPGFFRRQLNTLRTAVGDPKALAEGAAAIPGTVADYLSSRTPREFAGDVGNFGVNMVKGVAEHPVQTIASAIPFVGSAMAGLDAATARKAAAEARARGDDEGAKKLEQLASLAGMGILAGMVPFGGAAAKVAEKTALREAENAARLTAIKAAEKSAMGKAGSAAELAAKYGVNAPQIMRRADPAQKVMEARAAQLGLDESERLKPTGENVFETTPEAYARTESIVPQTSREQVTAELPRLPEGAVYPKGQRVEPLITHRDAIAERMTQHISGMDPNGAPSTFYHSGPMYEGLAERGGLGPEGAFDFMQNSFSPTYAGTSPRTNTLQNIRNGSLLQYLHAQGEDLPSYLEREGNAKGYGMLGMHYDLSNRLLSGTGDIHINPKPIQFGGAIGGDLNKVAADTHNIRAILSILNEIKPGSVPLEWLKPEARAKYLSEGVFDPARDVEDSLASVARNGKKSQVEYGPVADINTLAGKSLSIPSGVAQSRLWFAKGPETGLMSGEKTLVDLMNDQHNVTGQALGITPDDVLKMYAHHEIPLLAKGGLVEKYAEGGPVTPGNLDLHNRPVVHNPDGSISTVRSITVGFGDKTYVLPTVVGGKVVSNQEAIDHFKQTGEHLGVFGKPEDADAYAQRLHEDQAKEYEGKARGGLIAKYAV